MQRETSAAAEQQPRMRLFATVTRPLQAFLRMEAASGILLLTCAVGALLWANLDAAHYQAFFDYRLTIGAGSAVAYFSIRDLINDGCMTLFFFVVGMEIKREHVVGELNTLAKASLPAIAAIGGMIVPACIFLAFNAGGDGKNGWGIPMATDIAFCVGVLTLLKGRVPRALVVFVTALAIFDDIGGILVIAFFYGHGLGMPWLIAAGGLTLVAFAMGRLRMVNGLAYAIVGACSWYCLHAGGIHATISGVILGLMIPARPQRTPRDVLHELASHVSDLGRKPPNAELDAAEILGIEERLEALQAPVWRFVHLLHPFVAFLIMPAFAVANSGVSLRGFGLDTLTAPVALGTAVGLFAGKQVGIFLSTMLAVKLRVAPMPGNASKLQLLGVSIIAGIGFTVALFIAALAYPGANELLDQAKIGILIGSAAAGIVGFLLLRAQRTTT